MGASSSKHNAAAPSPAPSPSTTSSVVKRTPSYTRRVFQSSCLRSHNDDPQVSDQRTKENGSNSQCVMKTNSMSGEVETRRFNKVKVEKPDIDLNEWGQSSFPEIVSRGGSAYSRVFSSRSFNSTSSFASRCSFLPASMSFRLSRANNLGSSGALCTSSTGSAVTDVEGEIHGRSSTSDVPVNGDERAQSCNLFSACFSIQSPRPRHQVFSNNNIQSPDLSDNWLDDQHIVSAQDDTSSPRNHTCIENVDTRPSNRRIAAREPINRNVRFSRTMSVGRLRERSSFLDTAVCPFQEDWESGHASQANGRLGYGASSEPEVNIMISPVSSRHPQSFVPGSSIRGQDYEAGIPRARQARYLDIFEHRSNLLERRRRIRSQARALQRIGNRFQHHSGHERSCILSGQHRTGPCICRVSTQQNNSNNETTPMSRIVVLAEALFEVLDGIHQQSVLLSSQTSVSSIGSVPAPNETVESLPVRLYSRVPKHWKEESDQCYICLLEYEEGDTVRTLPCHHEFHKTCVDKWLKEIHRVCPLCRGDICRPQSSASED